MSFNAVIIVYSQHHCLTLKHCGYSVKVNFASSDFYIMKHEDELIGSRAKNSLKYRLFVILILMSTLKYTNWEMLYIRWSFKLFSHIALAFLEGMLWKMTVDTCLLFQLQPSHYLLRRQWLILLYLTFHVLIFEHHLGVPSAGKLFFQT